MQSLKGVLSSVEHFSEKKIKLHPNLLDILFIHKDFISRKLCDIRGIYSLDHFAINLINPNKELIIFSITPSVEYNLLTQGLWKYDNSFDPTTYDNKSMIWWDHAYHNEFFYNVKKIKESTHCFSVGFNLVRKIDEFCLVYSFATREKRASLRKYYLQLIDELFLLGDYGYELLKDLYAKYSAPYSPPCLELKNKIFFKEKSYLKLIVNDRYIPST